MGRAVNGNDKKGRFGGEVPKDFKKWILLIN